jgi:hypothetical protein
MIWMAMSALNTLSMALELARLDSVYDDVATKLGEHFTYIVNAMNHVVHRARADVGPGGRLLCPTCCPFPDCTSR